MPVPTIKAIEWSVFLKVAKITRDIGQPFNHEEQLLFRNKPGLWPLYEQLSEQNIRLCTSTIVQVKNTQISLSTSIFTPAFPCFASKGLRTLSPEEQESVRKAKEAAKLEAAAGKKKAREDAKAREHSLKGKIFRLHPVNEEHFGSATILYATVYGSPII